MGHLRWECTFLVKKSFLISKKERGEEKVEILDEHFSFDYGVNESSSSHSFGHKASSFLGKLQAISPSIFILLSKEELSISKEWESREGQGEPRVSDHIRELSLDGNGISSRELKPIIEVFNLGEGETLISNPSESLDESRSSSSRGVSLEGSQLEFSLKDSCGLDGKCIGDLGKGLD